MRHPAWHFTASSKFPTFLQCFQLPVDTIHEPFFGGTTRSDWEGKISMLSNIYFSKSLFKNHHVHNVYFYKTYRLVMLFFKAFCSCRANAMQILACQRQRPGSQQNKGKKKKNSIENSAFWSSIFNVSRPPLRHATTSTNIALQTAFFVDLAYAMTCV